MNRLFPSVGAERPTDTPQWLDPAYTRSARATITGWNGGDARLLHAAARMASLHAVVARERRAQQAWRGRERRARQHPRTRLGLLLIRIGIALGGQPASHCAC